MTVAQSSVRELKAEAEGSMTTRNPQWTWDELILLLDLYFRYDPRSLSSRHPAVQSLSRLLAKSNLAGDAPRNDRFRNPDGISMKIANLMHLDPDYPGGGLPSHSKQDAEAWNAFSTMRRECIDLAAAIRLHLQTEMETLKSVALVGPFDEAYEGSILLRVHQHYERNARLIAAKKAAALADTGDLQCEVCGFSFVKTYGEQGRGFIECHHAIPLSRLKKQVRTRLADLVLVCANCHRMLHRGFGLLSVAQLKETLGTQSCTSSPA